MIPLEYVLTILCIFSLYAIFAMGLNIMTGYAGLPHLGYMGLVAIGSYVTAILATSYNAPFVLTISLSALLTFLMGLLFGLAHVKRGVEKDYFIVSTIAFNYIVVSILLFAPYFGRMFGIIGIPRPEILGYTFSSTADILTLLLAFTALLAFVHWKLPKTRFGIRLRAAANDPILAEYSGIAVTYHRALGVALSSLYAGIGGSLHAYFLGVAYPYFFEFEHSVLVFAILLLGGRGTFAGPLIGALVMAVLPEIFRGWVPLEMRTLVIYIILAIIVLTLPSGIVGSGSPLQKLFPQRIASKR